MEPQYSPVGCHGVLMSIFSLSLFPAWLPVHDLFGLLRQAGTDVRSVLVISVTLSSRLSVRSRQNASADLE